jgi:hypothetical protein
LAAVKRGVSGIPCKQTKKGGPTNMEIMDKTKVLKPAEVTIKTLDGTEMKAKVNLAHENRISDLFTKTDNPFIVLLDVDYPGAKLKKVMVLNKQYIVWAEPGD